ncbi:sigma factor-like helix-turn-helix DNA-binding protein [Nocardia sp. NPDC050175]|uniref:sigma factor-like helix-turn-helix DNA-binding protein n=1 Tax=Nocardia sp. NPDC050175 TaxID=3364317 RepID=UPI0037A1ADC4
MTTDSAEPRVAYLTHAGCSTLETLMDALAAGDRHALGLRYDQLAPVVSGVVMAVVGDRAQSEIIVLEVFAELGHTARQYRRAKDGLLARVVAAAHRRAVEQVRATRAAACRESNGGDTRARSGTAIENRIGQQIPKRMLELPVPERHAVVLAYYGAYTYQEIAEILGIPLETTINRIRSGLLQLRR